MITGRGTKNRACGKMIHFLDGISSRCGVILLEEYPKMDKHYFAKFVQNTLHKKLMDLAELKGLGELIFVIDNDRSQTHRVALDAVEDCAIQFLSILPRSPCINPIENVFHLVRSELRKEAMEQKICKESFLQFEERVLRTMKNCKTLTIDKANCSLPNRLKVMSRNKGYCIKY